MTVRIPVGLPFGISSGSPWASLAVTRRDALLLLNLTEQELDQLGLECRYIQSPLGGLQIVYEPSVFKAILDRMRDEMTRWRETLATVQTVPPDTELDFATVH